MVAMVAVYTTIALTFFGIFMYWRTRKKRWLLLALGFFLLTSGVITTTIITLLTKLGVYDMAYNFEFSYWLARWLYRLELITSTTMIAVALGFIFKGMWDNYKAKPN